MSYNKHNWVNVPNPSSPPTNAVALSSRILNEMEDGIERAYTYADTVANENNPCRYSGIIKEEVGYLPTDKSFLTVSIDLGNKIKNRVTAYLYFIEKDYQTSKALCIMCIDKRRSQCPVLATMEGLRFYCGGSVENNSAADSGDWTVTDDDISLHGPGAASGSALTFAIRGISLEGTKLNLTLQDTITYSSPNIGIEGCWEGN